MRIKVTQDKITNSVKRNSNHCMIADAIKETFPQAQHIMVDLQAIRFSDPNTGMRYTYLTPPPAQRALLRFDRGDAGLRAFAFELGDPVRVQPRQQEDTTAAVTARRKARKYKRVQKIVITREREFGIRKWEER